MGANSLRSLEEQRADERSLSAQFIAAFDAMQEFHRAEAKRRAGGVGSSTEDGTRASAPERATEQSVPPASPRKRRTKAEMQEFRADKARQIQESYHSLVPAETREWLDAPDPLLNAILEGQPDADS
jgi:hypothetical protein